MELFYGVDVDLMMSGVLQIDYTQVLVDREDADDS